MTTDYWASYTFSVANAIVMANSVLGFFYMGDLVTIIDIQTAYNLVCEFNRLI